MKFKIIFMSTFIVVVCLSGCKKFFKSSGDVKQSNSVEASGFEAVKKVAVGGGYCTGTAISQNIVLTAAHCDSGEMTVDGQKPIAVFTNPLYKSVNSMELQKRDFHDSAVLVFEQNLFKPIATISQTPPSVGDDVLLVGYGELDNESLKIEAKEKRCGLNKIFGFAQMAGSSNDALNNRGESMVVIRGESRPIGMIPGINTQAARGDSGGPVFVNGELVATVVQGEKILGRHIDESTFANLFDSHNRNFINQFLFLGTELEINTLTSNSYLAQIKTIIPNGPASTAGLNEGDRIIAVGTAQDSMTALSEKEFFDLIQTATELWVSVLRGEETKTVKVVLDRQSVDEAARQISREQNAAEKCRISYTATVIDRLGFSVQQVAIRSLPSSFVVEYVEAGSPAEATKILVGAVVTKLEGEDVTTVQEFRDKISGLRKSEIKIEIDLSRRAPDLVVGQQPLYIRQSSKPRFGARLLDCDQRGLCVTEVAQDSPAEKAGVRVGDRVWMFNNVQMNEEKDYLIAVDNAPDTLVNVVLAGDVRGTEDVTVSVQLNKPDALSSNKEKFVPVAVQNEDASDTVNVVGSGPVTITIKDIGFLK